MTILPAEATPLLLALAPDFSQPTFSRFTVLMAAALLTTGWRYGHKWVVLCVLIRFPFAVRPWALPLLVDLYRNAEQNKQRKRPHRTPAQLMCRLLRLILLWFPQSL
ncbi:MAG: hypothetical protein ACYC3I_08380 [Gemmataceae bacterium]